MKRGKTFCFLLIISFDLLKQVQRCLLSWGAYLLQLVINQRLVLRWVSFKKELLLQKKALLLPFRPFMFQLTTTQTRLQLQHLLTLMQQQNFHDRLRSLVFIRLWILCLQCRECLLPKLLGTSTMLSLGKYKESCKNIKTCKTLLLYWEWMNYRKKIKPLFNAHGKFKNFSHNPSS